MEPQSSVGQLNSLIDEIRQNRRTRLDSIFRALLQNPELFAMDPSSVPFRIEKSMRQDVTEEVLSSIALGILVEQQQKENWNVSAPFRFFSADDLINRQSSGRAIELFNKMMEDPQPQDSYSYRKMSNGIAMRKELCRDLLQAYEFGRLVERMGIEEARKYV